MQKIMSWCIKKFEWILAIILFVILIAFGSNKAGFFVDEYFSFLNANLSPDELTTIIASGENTYSGQELIDMCLIRDQEERFDYQEVWKNQEADTHPPLYYAIVHTVCSFTMTHFDMITIGIAINIVIAMLIYFVLVKLIMLFVGKKSSAAIYAFLYCISFSFINCFLFIRMYLLLTLFTILLVYVLCSNIEREHYPMRFYFKLFIVICGGMLTQYYFGIFLAFSSMVVLIYLLSKKRYKNIVLGLITVLGAILCFYLIFPKGINHIFFGDRGSQAIDNMVNANLSDNIAKMFQIINTQVFGNCIYFIGAILIFLLITRIYYLIKNKETINITINHTLLLLPSLLSFILISKIAAYLTDRYVMALMPEMFLGCFLLIRQLLQPLWKSSKSDILTWLLMLGCILLAYRDPIPFMIDGDRACIAQINQFDQNTKCIYLYDEGKEWAAQCNLFELENLNEITFLPHTDFLYYCIDFSQYDTLLLYNSMDIDSDEVKNIAETSAQIGQYTECSFLFKFGYAYAYVLKR